MRTWRVESPLGGSAQDISDAIAKALRLMNEETPRKMGEPPEQKYDLISVQEVGGYLVVIAEPNTEDSDTSFFSFTPSRYSPSAAGTITRRK